MYKYSEEFKLKIVKEHKETHIGAERLQKKYGVHHSQIEQWIAQFELTGTFTKPTRHFSGEFKLKVLNYQQEHHLSDLQTALIFGITNHGTICAWRKKYITGGTEALFQKQGRRSKMPKKSLIPNKPREEWTKDEELAYLRMENDFLKKISGLSSGRRQEETAAEKRQRTIDAVRELRSKYNVSDLTKLTGLPRSSFYYSETHPKQDKHKEERELVQQIYHANKGRYGYRRITLGFRNRSFSTNHKVIQKLMHEEHIVCKVRQYKYNSYKDQIGKIAPNLLQRDFSTTKSNEKWVTDVTQFNLFGTKLYLSPILDLHDQSLISWNLSESPNYAQTVDMLEKAFAQIPDGTNLILHSDQGWQYQMYDYQRRLKEKGIR